MDRRKSKIALSNLQKITQDQEVLKLVKGCPIPFLTSPPINKGFEPRFSDEESAFVGLEIQKMLHKGAIQVTEETLIQFISHLFLRLKKDGSQPPIFNLEQLNYYVAYRHFKMEGLPLLRNLIQQDDWMSKIDLKDAYFCVRMKSSHQRFLGRSSVQVSLSSMQVRIRSKRFYSATEANRGTFFTG